MFDYVTAKPTEEPGRPRYLTTGFSALIHVVVLAAAVGLPILYASDELPSPPDMMAFVMEAPPPPPPPPPPAPPAPPPAKEPEVPKPSQPTLETPKPVMDVRAPVEAPAAIAPETGLETAVSSAPKVEAGFETGVPGGIPGGVVGAVETGAPPPPPPPKAPSGPVRVGGNIRAPELVHRVNPEYPPAAQAAQIQGTVVLEATVDRAGRVQNVRVVRSSPLLDAAAIAAVKQWRYEPLNLNGQPMPFILTVTVSFAMPR